MTRLACLLALAALLGPVAVAGAQDGARPGYQNVPGAAAPAGTQPAVAAQQQGELDTGGGSLPFTGLDLTIVALAGAVLLATGLVLRRSAGGGARG